MENDACYNGVSTNVVDNSLAHNKTPLIRAANCQPVSGTDNWGLISSGATGQRVMETLSKDDSSVDAALGLVPRKCHKRKLLGHVLGQTASTRNHKRQRIQVKER